MGKATKCKGPEQSRAKKPQSRANKPQRHAKVPQSRAQKGPQPRAKKEPQPRAGKGRQSPTPAPTAGGDVQGPHEACNPYSNGWKACLDFLHDEGGKTYKATWPKPHLIQIHACHRILGGVQAQVAWYVGGNDLADVLEGGAAVAEPRPGVYLATATWYWHTSTQVGEAGAVASLENLRWLGTTTEFLATTRASKKTLDQEKYDRLVIMLEDTPFAVGCKWCRSRGRLSSQLIED